MPVTYWLELVRRALVGSVAEAFPTLSGLSNLQLLGILCGLTIVFAGDCLGGIPSVRVSCPRAGQNRYGHQLLVRNDYEYQTT